MLKKLLIVVTVLAGVSLCIYAGYKIFPKCKSIVTYYNTAIHSSLSMLAAQSRSFSAQRPLKVVCLGNSITKHGYLPDVEWYSDWGMAASCEENDYCHVLQKRLREYNGESCVIPYNIAHFERNPDCDINSLLGNVCEGADVIVIRIGDNVNNAGFFAANLQRLIDKCKEYTPHILVSGCFWQKGEVEKTLMNGAANNGLRFIPLSWIGEIRNAYPHKGDTIFNTDGKPYTITKDFILTHPNDEGMKAIADAIFNAITWIDPDEVKNGVN